MWCAFLALAALLAPTAAAPGDIDSGFSFRFTFATNEVPQVGSVAKVPGGYVVCGTVRDTSATPAPRAAFLMRMGSTGALDRTFGVLLRADPTMDLVSNEVVYHELRGRILWVMHANNATNSFWRVDCVRANGTVDTGFGPGGQGWTSITFGGSNEEVYGIQGVRCGTAFCFFCSVPPHLSSPVLADGSCVLCGTTGGLAACAKMSASSGALITSFGSRGRRTFNFPNTTAASISDMIVDAQQNVYGAGFLNRPGEPLRAAIWKMSSNGVNAPDFVQNAQGVVGVSVYDEAPLDAGPAEIRAGPFYSQHGSLVSVGSLKRRGAVGSSSFVMRVLEDGVMDTAFGSGGFLLLGDGQSFPPGNADLQLRGVVLE